MALREGLAAHKLRTGLTMLGIIFGIASVIAMTAITEGGKRQQLNHLRQIGMNNIQLRDLDLKAAPLLRQRRINPRGVNGDDLDHLLKYVEGIEAATSWKHILAETSLATTASERRSCWSSGFSLVDLGPVPDDSGPIACLSTQSRIKLLANAT